MKGRAAKQNPLAVSQAEQIGSQIVSDRLIILWILAACLFDPGQGLLPVPGSRRWPPQSLIIHNAARVNEAIPLAFRQLPLLNGPPGFAASVKNTAARDRDILQPFSIERRLAAKHLSALIGGHPDRISFELLAEHNKRTGRGVKLNPALQGQRTGVPDPGRDDHLPLLP